jgi:hypothetical protein
MIATQVRLKASMERVRASMGAGEATMGDAADACGWIAGPETGKRCWRDDASRDPMPTHGAGGRGKPQPRPAAWSRQPRPAAWLCRRFARPLRGWPGMGRRASLSIHGRLDSPLRHRLSESAATYTSTAGPRAGGRAGPFVSSTHPVTGPGRRRVTGPGRPRRWQPLTGPGRRRLHPVTGRGRWHPVTGPGRRQETAPRDRDRGRGGPLSRSGELAEVDVTSGG